MLITSKYKSAKKKQDGITLLVVVIALAITISVYYFSSISIVEIETDKIKKTQSALKQAKQALLAYAAVRAELTPAMVSSTQPGRYGFLPCPANISATNNIGDGISVGNCNTAKKNSVGWFPWRSLKMQPLRDGNGDCLYYALSSSYKASPDAGMLNEDSYGMLQVVDGNGNAEPSASVDDQVVAIVFSVGHVINGQTRSFLAGTSCGYDDSNNSSQPEAFLDSLDVAPGAPIDVVDNSDVDTITDDSVDRFVKAASVANEGIINDRFITITREEVWGPVVSRSDFNQKMENLTQALAMCLAAYANQADNNSRRLPWPVATNLSGLDYRDEDNYEDDSAASNGYSGRYPFDITDSNNVINAASLTNDQLLEIPGLCDNLPVNAGVTLASLSTDGSEYRNLWNNWKDHFFYTLSKRYAPASSGESQCDATGSQCIKIAPSNTKYAAAVIFSGLRLAAQNRSDKAVVNAYLEDGKGDEFVDELTNKTGNRTYNYTDPQTNILNDIMYCVEDVPATNPLTVVECS